MVTTPRDYATPATVLTAAAMGKLFSANAPNDHLARRPTVRGIRLREGLPCRETLSRRQDRKDLRGTSNLQLQTIAKQILGS